MSPKSARALMWLSLMLLVLGSMIGSPAAAVLLLLLAALCAVAPILTGPVRPRIVGIVLLLASVGLAAALFPAALRHMSTYRDRGAKVKSEVPPAPARNP